MRFEFILLTKTTAALNEVALTYYKVRRLSFLAVVFVATIISLLPLRGRIRNINYFRLTKTTARKYNPRTV